MYTHTYNIIYIYMERETWIHWEGFESKPFLLNFNYGISNDPLH